MIVISAQAAGVQLARGEEAGSIYKYCTAPFRLCRSSFQFKEGIDRVALSRIGFRVDPTSNSPYLPLPVSFVSRSSFPSLPGHAAAASFAKARRFSGRISRLNIDREGKKEETEEGLRETFPLLSSPSLPSPGGGNGSPAAKSHVLYLLQKGVLPIRSHAYTLGTQRGSAAAVATSGHHAHSRSFSLFSPPLKARFLGTTAERGRTRESLFIIEVVIL